MKYIPFIIALFILWSCSDLGRSKQLMAIDNMNKSLDSIQSVLKENEIDTLAALRVATNSVEIRIKNYYDADTIDMAFGKKMDAYKVMRRQLGSLSKNYSVIKNGVTDERVTLKNLKSDIDKGYGDRNKYDEYVMHEESKVQQLRVLLKAYVEDKNKTMAEFHRLHDELYAFSISLLEKNKK